jgi:L-ascorbate metabolism protein UlaG (beta-lactamase superfamily)
MANMGAEKTVDVRALAAVMLSLAWFGAHLLAADRIPANGGDIIITPIIHSSVQLEHAGVVVQLDPWSAADLSSAKAADLVLITDDVGHHLDLKAIQRLRKPGAPIVIPAAAKAKIPDGTVLPNGDATTLAGVRVESIAAYDIKPGEPSHPKGEANGYVVTLGGKRIYFGGVTECVPEVKALRNIDVAFVPMNLPLERMTPQAAAECIKSFRPGIVYPYHYDQDYASRIGRGEKPSGGSTLGFDALRKALSAEPFEIRTGAWY